MSKKRYDEVKTRWIEVINVSKRFFRHLCQRLGIFVARSFLACWVLFHRLSISNQTAASDRGVMNRWKTSSQPSVIYRMQFSLSSHKTKQTTFTPQYLEKLLFSFLTCLVPKHWREIYHTIQILISASSSHTNCQLMQSFCCMMSTYTNPQTTNSLQSRTQKFQQILTSLRIVVKAAAD